MSSLTVSSHRNSVKCSLMAPKDSLLVCFIVWLGIWTFSWDGLSPPSGLLTIFTASFSDAPETLERILPLKQGKKLKWWHECLVSGWFPISPWWEAHSSDRREERNILFTDLPPAVAAGSLKTSDQTENAASLLHSTTLLCYNVIAQHYTEWWQKLSVLFHHINYIFTG